MLKVLALLIAVWAANGYGFTDLAYNNNLMTTLALNNDVALIRHRRAVNAEKVNVLNVECCTGDKIVHEDIRSCVDKVNTDDLINFDLNDCEKSINYKAAVSCLEECVARDMKLIDEDRKLNRENIIKHYRENLIGDVEWKKNALEGYVDDCMTEAETMKKEYYEQCLNLAANLHACMKAKFITGCPAELRVDSDFCSLRRTHPKPLTY